MATMKLKKKLYIFYGKCYHISKFILSSEYRKKCRLGKEIKKAEFEEKDDEKYLKLLYKYMMDKELNLVDPQTFNEKLQWLKLHDRKDLYTTMADKYAVKKFVAAIIGEEYIIPTLGVWDKFDDIDFGDLPDRFVIKTTHDSGGAVICKDKTSFDKQKAKEFIESRLKKDYYLHCREWPYKNIPHRIIVEKYMEDDVGNDLQDYKIHCFNGVPKIILVGKNRFSASGLTVDFFDIEWNHLDMKRSGHNNSATPITPPDNLKLMLKLSEKLSENIPFLRVDLYEIKGAVYFGELTFFPAAGLEKFYPEKWDYVLGEWLDLSKTV